MFGTARSLLALFAFPVLLCQTAATAEEPFRLSLAGEHPFHTGDNPAWSDPAFDDSGWPTIPVPGTWAKAGISSFNVFGWYRIHFTLPPGAPNHLALRIGELGYCADETWLNGQKIGGLGKIAKDGYDASAQGRVYPIPEKLLHQNGDNVIAIRICRLYDTAGIRTPPIQIANFDAATREQTRRDAWTTRAECVSLFALFCGIVFSAVSGFSCGWNREFTSLLILFSSIFAGLFCYSTLAEVLGVQNHILYFTAGSLCTWAFVVSYVIYLQAVLHFKIGPALKTAILGSAIVMLLMAIYPAPLNHYLTGETSLLYFPFILFNGAIAVITLSHFFRTRRRKEPGKKLVLGAVLVLLLSFAISFVELPRYIGLDLPPAIVSTHLMVCLFVLFLLGASALRFLADRERVAILSSKILHTQEEERKRVARDLHDGVAQSLQGIRLQTQLLHRQNEAPELEVLADALQQTLDDVRRTARELRPDYLEHLTLVEAIEWHAGQFGEQIHFTIQATGLDEKDIGLPMKEHLFRIFQEALTNAVKHGGAGHFTTSLKIEDGILTASFSDNGTGFTPSDAETSGIGLSTMRERVDLLRGAFDIDSGKEKGTTIHLTVPLRHSPIRPEK